MTARVRWELMVRYADHSRNLIAQGLELCLKLVAGAGFALLLQSPKVLD